MVEGMPLEDVMGGLITHFMVPPFDDDVVYIYRLLVVDAGDQFVFGVHSLLGSYYDSWKSILGRERMY